MTHKVYCDLWKAPEEAAMAIDVRSEKPQTLLVAVDAYVAEVKLGGDGQWQPILLSPADFRNRSGRALRNWQGIMELKQGQSKVWPPGTCGDSTIHIFI